MIINCKEKAQQIKDKIKEEVSKINGKKPKLTIVQVGNIEASNRYVRNKIKDCEEVGIKANLVKFDENITTEDLVEELIKEQHCYGCDGIIVQLPLPKHIDKEKILKTIDDDKDVDGFKKLSPFIPCTPKGIMKIFEMENIDLKGKDVLIINRSNIVGKPLINLLLDKDATVTIAHSKTKYIEDLVKRNEIVITAVGQADFINKNNINRYTETVIDVGINFNEDGKLCGDVAKGMEEYFDVTPVPGGVGLMTRAMLLENVLEAYKTDQKTLEFKLRDKWEK